MYKNIHVVTVAKVASATFNILMRKNNFQSVTHTHDLSYLRDVLNRSKHNLIISGIRDPIARNLSYYFQGFQNPYHSQFKIKSNNYTGEVIEGVWKNRELQIDYTDVTKAIDNFKVQKWLYTFNDWFTEFFDIVDIKETSFNKSKGYKIYKLSNNNTILLYTLEKLKQSIKQICIDMGIVEYDIHWNNSADRSYNKLYRDVKKNITYDKSYIDNLLHTDVMNYFYTPRDIKLMYDLYTII